VLLHAPAPTAPCTLSLHDALPISEPVTVLDELAEWDYGDDEGRTTAEIRETRPGWTVWAGGPAGGETITDVAIRCHRVLRRAERSEEHTSELQSRSDLVCRLLLEK